MTMTYDLEIHIEELRLEAGHCHPAERVQIEAELEQARAELAAAIAAQDGECVGEPPH
jgi:outer membrane protein TolC